MMEFNLMDVDRPPIVEEAEQTLRDYRLRIARVWGIAAGGLLLATLPFAGSFAPIIVISLGFWPSVAAGVLAIHPIGRRADRARTVLKKWTELQTEGVLGSQTQPPDPRIDVAARMVERILSHPSTPRDAVETVTRTEAHLRKAVDDLSTISVRRRLEGPDAATSDVETELEMRVARLLSALGELHQSVVARDLAEVQVHLTQLRDLVELSRASAEVDALLGQAYSGSAEHDTSEKRDMSEWIAVREYGALFEAEMAKQRLEQSDIPVLLKGPITGAFGPGFSGATAQGVTLLVPDDHRDAAVELLADDEF
jgi:hypothetical protein